MAADRRTPVTKSAKPVRKTPATAAAVAIAAAEAVVDKANKVSAAGYVLEDQVGFHLRRAHQRATLIFNEVMAKFDITPTQFAALAKIDDEGAISQNHLGRLTAMDPSTILGVVGRLQRQGLVHLKSTPGDARLTMIELTLDGQKRVAEMKTVAAEVSKRTMSPLKPADAKTLNELLSRIG
jgi:MarR family transcriptional regulator, lower aerobic nicotinate degradation pathway regulator